MVSKAAAHRKMMKIIANDIIAWVNSFLIIMGNAGGFLRG